MCLKGRKSINLVKVQENKHLINALAQQEEIDETLDYSIQIAVKVLKSKEITWLKISFEVGISAKMVEDIKRILK